MSHGQVGTTGRQEPHARYLGNVRAALIVAVSDTRVDEWVPSFHHPTYIAALTLAADAAMDAAAALASDTAP